MKYSQLIGILCGCALIAVCFMPWSFVASKQLLLTGMDTTGTKFGRPGIMAIFLSVLTMILFAIPKVLAKRINVFVAAILLAWAIRNFILMSTCYLGECPERRLGLYLLLLFASLIMIMSLLPKIEIRRSA